MSSCLIREVLKDRNGKRATVGYAPEVWKLEGLELKDRFMVRQMCTIEEGIIVQALPLKMSCHLAGIRKTKPL